MVGLLKDMCIMGVPLIGAVDVAIYHKLWSERMRYLHL